MNEYVDDLRRFKNIIAELADLAGSFEHALCNTALEEAESEQPAENGMTPASVDLTREKPQPTFEEVRARLADLSRAGYAAEIRAMLGRHGASRLSEVAPGDYAALLKEARELGGVDDVPF